MGAFVAGRKSFGRRFTFSPLFTPGRLRIPSNGRTFMNDLDLAREAPRLDPIPFIVADVILIGFAAFIGWQAPAPLGVAPLAAISGLVALGAIAGLYPFVINHARRQEESLRERTEQIEALARTLAGASEQVGIAVSNLPAIAEHSSRQLKLAEQLPAIIQAQLATLQHQLSATHAEENAALRHELDTLRNAQTDKLANALADLARLEALAAKHTADLDGAIAHLPRLAETFNLQTAETLRRETAAAVAALQAASNDAGIALASATTEARTAFDRGVRDAVSHLATQATSNPPFPAHTLSRPAVIAPPAVVKPCPEPAPASEIASIDDDGLDEPSSESQPAELAQTSAAQPEPRIESKDADTAPAENSEPEPEENSDSAAPPDSGAEDQSGSASTEPALSHDGFTRLVATAYIGIGNKLHIRGDGPGLRRDKGVPLQFVSIGKWRWESAELLFPVKVRLYKNDQIECAALGEITLEPGHHHEVSAQF
jgi:hypothetical protein